MHPIILGGSHLVLPALVGAAKSIPAAQLAKYGLLRGPLVGFGPVLGAFIGGAATVAMLVPGSRAWIKAHAGDLLEILKGRNPTAQEGNGAGGRARRSRNAVPAADIGE
jgi:hypothetical protein